MPPKDVNDRVSYRFEAYLLRDYFLTSWRLKKKSSRSYLDEAAQGEGSFDEWFDEWEWEGVSGHE